MTLEVTKSKCFIALVIMTSISPAKMFAYLFFRSDVCFLSGGTKSRHQNDQDVLPKDAGREHFTGNHSCPDRNDAFC